jgi:hypothetical protein
MSGAEGFKRAAGEAARRAKVKFSVKASVLRGRVHALRARSSFEVVASAVSEPLRALLHTPPLVSSWIDGAALVEIDDVIYDVLGEAALNEIALATVRDGLTPILRNVVEGMLQLFGATPGALLSRMDALSRSTVRGMSFSWEHVAATEGRLTVAYPDSADMPNSAFVAIRAGVVNLYDLVGAKGTIELSPRSNAAPRNAAPFRCRW